MDLEGSATHQNLLAAFANESQASRRYQWFAEQADVEGRPEAAAMFRSIAAIEAGHAQGHLEYLAEIGDPLTGDPIGDTDENIRAAINSETHESAELFPRFAAAARDEGFHEVAEWFDAMTAAEATHTERLRALLGDEETTSTS